MGYPAAYPTVIAVGAIEKLGGRADFSQYGSNLSVVGPGVEINSSGPGKAYVAELLVHSGEGTEETIVRNTLGFGSGYLDAPLTAPVVFAGLGREADYEGVALESKIALINRGEISFFDKVRNAIQAGAVAVVIANNEPGLFVGMVQEKGQVSIPVLFIEQEFGKTIYADIVNGKTSMITISMELRTNYLIMGWNINV